jgi:hypothetical protein
MADNSKYKIISKMEQSPNPDNSNEEDKLEVMTAKFQAMKKERDELKKENTDLHDQVASL